MMVFDSHGEIGESWRDLDKGTSQDTTFTLGPFLVFDDVAWIVGMLIKKQEKIDDPRYIRGHEKGCQYSILE